MTFHLVDFQNTWRMWMILDQLMVCQKYLLLPLAGHNQCFPSFLGILIVFGFFRSPWYIVVLIGSSLSTTSSWISWVLLFFISSISSSETELTLILHACFLMEGAILILNSIEGWPSLSTIVSKSIISGIMWQTEVAGSSRLMMNFNRSNALTVIWKFHLFICYF